MTPIATSTPMRIVQAPPEYAGSLSLSLAYAIGRHSFDLGRHCNPYPDTTTQAKAWAAGRAEGVTARAKEEGL